MTKKKTERNWNNKNNFSTCMVETFLVFPCSYLFFLVFLDDALRRKIILIILISSPMLPDSGDHPFYPSVAIVAREFPARHLRFRMPVPGCRRTERTTSEVVAGVLLLYVESPVVPFSDMFYYNND